MKILSILIIRFCFICITFHAQIRRQTNPSQNIVSDTLEKNNKKQILKELNLTKDQMGQMKDLRRTMKQKRADINNNPDLTQEQKQEKIKELRIEQREKLSTILTPEQMEKLKEERKNMDTTATNKQIAFS